jgi:hypothetical protein
MIVVIGLKSAEYVILDDFLPFYSGYSRGIEPFSPTQIEGAYTSQPPNGERIAWTNHIYFQITQPGRSTVTPLYQYCLPVARKRTPPPPRLV